MRRLHGFELPYLELGRRQLPFAIVQPSANKRACPGQPEGMRGPSGVPRLPVRCAPIPASLLNVSERLLEMT